MKSLRKSALAAVILASACPLFGGAGVSVTVTNPSPHPRKAETVEVPLVQLLACDSLVGREGIGVVDKANGNELVAQRTDTDVLFQSDFGPRETKTFLVRSKQRSEISGSKVDGYFARPREDYAWENDRIAFRMYGPALAAEVNNGIDVWTKRVRGLIVRKWYEEDTKEGKGTYYHTDRGEGADFFAVGKTLGAGGCGIWYKDSLYQPGVFSSYRTLENGPIRTSFELTYLGWNVGGRKFTETKRISLDAGSNLNRIEVVFNGARPEDSLRIACGLVKRKSVTVHVDQRGGMLVLWGRTNDEPANGSLGTGVLMNPSSVVGSHDDSSQVLLLGPVAGGKPFIYRAGAGWTRSGDFSDSESWLAYLQDLSVRIGHPLRISVLPSGE